MLRPAALAIVLSLALAPAAADPAPVGERVALAADTYALVHGRLGAGAGSTEEVYRWSVRWLEAQRDQPLKGKALAAAYAAHLERMRALETEVGGLFDRGQLTAVDRAVARYARLEAEAWAKIRR